MTQLDDSKNTGNEPQIFNRVNEFVAPNTTGNELEEIDRIALAFKTAYRLSGDNFREYEVKKAKRQIQALIEQQVLIGRIDEWELMHQSYPTAPYIPDFIWKERLTTLKAQLKEI